ncbi:MAG: uroporphyrinogen-III C-methyltransferase, partial [Pseudomonadota bacterium]
WTTFFRGPIAAQVLAGDEPGARDAMIAAVNAPDAGAPAGVVHIVGAGPGDPDLLTLRAHRLLQEADVIFYDRLVGDGVLDLARRDAERVFVGKAKADHAVPQRDIEAMMIARARAGDVVVRLKGGDPYVFGRGGEEREAMLAAGVDVTVTPGVTAAVGCAASVGAPLTHRDDAQAVTFVTGHAAGDADPDLDWGALAALGHTLVVYMGVTKAGRIAERLIAHGSDPTTPVAVVENGTRASEKVVPGRLADLEALIDAHAIAGPAVLIIGAVAARADAARRLAEEAAFSERAVA